MNASTLYRTASVLLFLFAVLHTIGFAQVDPAWRVDTLVGSMKSQYFDAHGSMRSYWDFYLGFGLFTTVLMLVAAVVAWQIGGLPADVRGKMRVTSWALVLCAAAMTYLSWRYFFVFPLAFSAVIFLCLLAAAVGRPVTTFRASSVGN